MAVRSHVPRHFFPLWQLAKCVEQYDHCLLWKTLSRFRGTWPVGGFAVAVSPPTSSRKCCMLHAPSLNCVLTLATLGVHRRCTRWICYRARRDRPWSSWERRSARRRRSLMQRRNEWQRWRLPWRVAARWLQIVNPKPVTAAGSRVCSQLC